MRDYYSEKLSAERLKLCYDVAPPRIKRYLEAETGFVLDRITRTDRVLELGCGYGRVLRRLIGRAQSVIGIDTSHESLGAAREVPDIRSSCHLARMDAVRLGFREDRFDVVMAIQNSIAVFGVDKRELIGEAIRVTRPGGRVLFSSYSSRIWDDRLEWFRIQSSHGLVGKIDEEATGDGTIVCEDGFRATAVGPDEFVDLASAHGIIPRITEVDESSVFCEILVP